MDLAKEFGTDPTKEAEGVWFDIRGAGFLLKRANNPEFRARSFKLARQNRRARRDEAADEVTTDLIVNTVLMDWRDVEERGEPLPFSKENAKRVLLQYRDLLDEIFERASDIEAYQTDQDEEIAKNSETS
jgi:hypothetical protein